MSVQFHQQQNWNTAFHIHHRMFIFHGEKWLDELFESQVWWEIVYFVNWPSSHLKHSEISNYHVLNSLIKNVKNGRRNGRIRWWRSRWMWSTSPSMDTSGIHIQVQKCMQNTSWKWTGVLDQRKRIYRTMQKLSTAALALGLLHNP